MHLFGKDLDHEVALVAEIGVNHEGDVEKASELVRLASESGADAVKFQSFTPARYASASDRARLARVTGFALDEAAHRRLAAEAAELGVVFFSTAVSEDLVPLLAELCPVIKIASGDLDFEPVIRAAAATGKPLIISTGLGTLDEVDQAVDWVRDEVGAAALPERLVLLQCVTAYPTPVAEANVLAVPLLAERYGVPVGFSNHVLGPEACYAAIAHGARLIEAHFTDARAGREFRDHALSFEPQEFEALAAAAPRIRAALGSGAKERQPSESGILAAVRKGVVAARDLPAGHELVREDLMYARPATEFAAHELPTLVGRRLVAAVATGELIARDNVGVKT